MTGELADLVHVAAGFALGVICTLVFRPARRVVDHRRTRRGVRPAKPTTPPSVGATPLPPPKRPTPTQEA